MRDFGFRVKQYRRLKGYTQAELAKKVGYSSKSTINKIELGYNDVPLSTVERLASALDVSPGTLMGWEEVFTDNDDIALTTEERVLLKFFRQMTPAGKDLALKTLKNMSETLRGNEDEY